MNDAAERAAELLQRLGVPAYAEPFDGSIRIEDDGAYWYWGTNNATWDADLLRDPFTGDCIGAARSDVPSESTDAQRIADAIVAALTRRVGVTIWPQEG